ncbi:lambda exonuclease family protein [Isoptericola sp. NPDC056605]|uniref:lambda exonuclease family protein n=1 Tax=Isoptericola sp. NPDC056605 TaxID=3345876 RepID=UPI00367A9A00
MTLRTFPDVIQGTDEWNDVRRGIVTASVVGQLVTASTLKVAANDTSRAVTALLVAERITGYTDPTYTSDDMWRGIEDEPRARAAYAEHTGVDVAEMGFMLREHLSWKLGYSPDGLVGDVGLIEIKSRRQKKHLATILADAVPAENVMQVQAGLLVTGRAWCDYVSYCGGMPLYVKRVYPDRRVHAAFIRAVRAFEVTAAEMTSRYHAAVVGLPTTERIEQELVI